MECHYDILGLEFPVARHTLKKKYHQLSLEFHPDKNSNSAESNRIFRQIHEAYTKINDSLPRDDDPDDHDDDDHDDDDHDDDDHDEFSSGILQLGKCFVNIWKELQKPRIIVHTENISLHDAYAGKRQLPIEITRWRITQPPASAASASTTAAAPAGQRVYESVHVFVDVPAGIDSNGFVILKGAGHISNEATPCGDVKVVFQIAHPFCCPDTHIEWHRHGNDLAIHKTLTLRESLCGFQFAIPHLNGQLLCISNSTAITHPGQRYVLPHLGMTTTTTTTRETQGNLVVIFEVAFPLSLSDAQREQISDILL